MNLLNPLDETRQIIVRRRQKAVRTRENRRLAASIIRMVIGIAIAAGIFLWLFSFHIVSGSGMYPALNDGDLTLTFSKSEYIKGDIVYYSAGSQEYCGRVAAKGGDTISFSDDGKFYVNGTVQTAGVAFPTYSPDSQTGTQTVSGDCVYILGDFRTQTKDSRDFGFIPLKNVKSKVIAVLRHKVL